MRIGFSCKRRWRVQASSDSSLSSLESLLANVEGKESGLNASLKQQKAALAAAPSAADAPTALREPPISVTDLTDLAEPKVRPDISTAMYYLVLVVYASIYATELISGGEAAEVLRGNLSNDHSAVQAGDALRLFSSAFVTGNVRQLGVTLLCLFTVGSELEALLGNGAYWALLCVSVVAGGFADAALSPEPITGGPAPIVGALVGALLAYHIKNWKMEAQLQQVREAHAAATGAPTGPDAVAMPPSLARARLRAMLFDLAGPPPRVNPLGEGEREGEGGGGGGGGSAFSSADEGLQQATLPIIDGIWEPVILVPREAKEFITLAGLAAACVSALLDAADASNYTGMAAAFAFGGSLGFGVAPDWRVAWALALKEGEATVGGGGSGIGSSGGSGGSGSLESSAGVYWRPCLVDVSSGPGRANALVGCVAVLYAALGFWLLAN